MALERVTSAAVLAATATAALGVLAPAALATTLNVTTETDAVGADGQCSLREAISNANAGFSTVLGPGECPPAAGDDTIVLPAGHFVLSRAGKSEDLNATGDLDLIPSSPMAIAGAGAGATTIDGNGVDRVLHVLRGEVTVRNLTITGGHAADGAKGDDVTSNFANPVGENGDPGESGGGIFNDGDLMVEDAVIEGNHAGNGGAGGAADGPDGTNGASGTIGFSATGGHGGAGGAGGGIASADTLSLVRTVVRSNLAGSGGAGGAATAGDGGDASSSVSGNGGTATGGYAERGGDGGGVWSDFGASLTVDASTISANRSGDGGAGGLAEAGNGGDGQNGATTAGTGGGGTGGNGGGGAHGGGFYVIGGPLTITRSLVSDNLAGHGGDGGAGTGGDGGGMATPNKAAGAGGNGRGGLGASGGNGGGVMIDEDASVTMLNSTVTANATGAGGHGATGTGGSGGNPQAALISNGNGGNGTGGDGFGGGAAGGLFIADNGDVRHATISENALGSDGPVGQGVAGAHGTGGILGNAGTASNGTAIVGSSPGGVYAGGSTPGSHVLLSSTIVSGNDTPTCAGDGLADGGDDVQSPDTSCFGTHADPLLGPLADNGGPTWTQAIGPGSPALDAVPASGAGCPAVDQRGVSRPRVSGCDAGAFEYAPMEASTGDATGVSATGATLNGQVVPYGHPTSYRFDYGTTDSYGSSTAPQDAGHGVESVPAGAAVGGLAPSTTYHYRLVATSADGTVAGADRTLTTQAETHTGTGDVPPVILSASLKPKRFAVRGKKKGTTFSYRLSEAATVTFTVKRRGGRMKAKTFRVASSAGANKHRFSGRFRKKALRPGRYRVTLVARDAAGHASKPKRLNFSVVSSR
jgi:CSLREA domain-containing protein